MRERAIGLTRADPGRAAAGTIRLSLRERAAGKGSAAHTRWRRPGPPPSPSPPIGGEGIRGARCLDRLYGADISSGLGGAASVQCGMPCSGLAIGQLSSLTSAQCEWFAWWSVKQACSAL